nr:olfactory receptor 36 [Tropidothorax elegans]
MKLPDETYELKNYKFALEFAGLWWDGENMSLKQKVFVILKFLNFTAFVVLLDISLCLIPTAQIPYKSYAPLVLWYNIMYCTAVFLLFFKQRDIIAFRAGVCRLISRYRSEWEILRFAEKNRKVWRFAIRFYFFLQFGVFILTIPVIVDVVLAICTHVDVFYVPFLMEGFLPEEKVRNFDFYFFQFLSSFLQIISITYYVCLIVMLLAIVNYITFILEVIDKNLRLWDLLDRNDPQRKILFKRIVADHAETLRLLKVINSAFAPSFCVQGLSWALNVGYYSHFIRKALQNNDYVTVVAEIYKAFVSATGIFLSNSLGEILFKKGLDVSQTIYSLRWFDEPKANQLDLMMVMRKAQVPVVMDFKNSFPLNFYNMAFLFNISYKLFVIMGTLDVT